MNIGDLGGLLLGLGYSFRDDVGPEFRLAAVASRWEAGDGWRLIFRLVISVKTVFPGRGYLGAMTVFGFFRRCPL